METLFGAVIAVLTYIVRQLRTHRQKQNNIEQALLAITKDRLYQSSKSYLLNGKIDIQEMDNINMMFEIYQKLGGNHGMEAVIERVRNLEVEE